MRKTIEAVVVGALAVAIAAAVLLSVRWWYATRVPTKVHVLVPEGRRVLLRAGDIEQCFALYPRESMQPLQVLESEDPIDLEADLVFNESERPPLDFERLPGTPAYETEKHTWLLVRTVRCGAPRR